MLLYHLDRSWAPGGFVGVDIFFVISGFVVTGSVLASKAKSPRAAILQFWRRRILRIMPAMLLMVIISTAALAMFRAPFPKESYDGELRSGISAILGIANFYLRRIGQDYFQTDQSANPFLHMWSLGVEEQFYLAFALGFIGVAGFISRRETRLRVSAFSMALLGMASYSAFLLNAQSNPSASYYFITYRFWEIAAGSLIAYFETIVPGFTWPRNVILATSLQSIAMLLLIKAIWLDRPSGLPVGPISVAAGSAVVLIATGSVERARSTEPCLYRFWCESD